MPDLVIDSDPIVISPYRIGNMSPVASPAAGTAATGQSGTAPAVKHHLVSYHTPTSSQHDAEIKVSDGSPSRPALTRSNSSLTRSIRTLPLPHPPAQLTRALALTRSTLPMNRISTRCSVAWATSTRSSPMASRMTTTTMFRSTTPTTAKAASPTSVRLTTPTRPHLLPVPSPALLLRLQSRRPLPRTAMVSCCRRVVAICPTSRRSS
ncbi:hypothetical protein N658DRAFT_59300 [Parathielavia hyrcaniae]|uniref:Uncharacterized protein n=1 Tax=Parathielavia hyrcaniae TaxID=113614 RepID=A0AAN6T194_9PEZI|nr:hypothetical protein N658DRAFT_59300 [Parathielavia hyrcaniae]